MCGICGYIEFNKKKAISKEVLKNMSQELIRRGPDDEGYFVNGNIGLGHRRLSIIDISGGHQPIFNEDKTIAIVFNGEIYNFKELRKHLEGKGHRFYTQSDTEVIVHAYEAWGIDCIRKMNGMFAFALWDSNTDTLFLVRDRMGKKPIYYCQMNDTFIFGSELKALLKHPDFKKELDFDSLSQYLAFEYVPSPRTIFKNVYKLPAGHFLKINVKSSLVYSPICFWDSVFSNTLNDLSIEETCERLVALLKESVRKRLISDVPLGVFLSGGIDSSIIVSLMSELMPSKSIKTFSIGFKESSFDESSYASSVARYFNTDHYEERFDSKAILEIMPEVASYLDEPFSDASVMPTYLLSKFARKNITVALSGDGGDELFCGYPTFIAHNLCKFFEVFPKSVNRYLYKLSMLLPASTDNFSLDFKIKQFLKGLSFPNPIRHQIWLGSFSHLEQKQLFNKQFNSNLRLSQDKMYGIIYDHLSTFDSKDELDKIIYLYYKLYLAEDILVKTDRASMANSLEVRTPFLDVDLVEFVNVIPNELKLKGMSTKYILKKAFRNKIPSIVIDRPKKGFGIPIAKWFKNDLKPLLLEVFNEKKIKKEGIFEATYIKNLLDQHFRGKRDHRKQIWTLFMFELWKENWYKN